MKKIKKIIVLTLLCLSGYSVIKFINKIRDFFNLKDNLAQYLLDVLGERPEIKVNYSAIGLNIELGCSESLIEKEEELKQIVKSYVSDYYPSLAGYKKNVKIYSTDK